MLTSYNLFVPFDRLLFCYFLRIFSSCFSEVVFWCTLGCFLLCLWCLGFVKFLWSVERRLFSKLEKSKSLYLQIFFSLFFLTILTSNPYVLEVQFYICQCIWYCLSDYWESLLISFQVLKIFQTSHFKKCFSLKSLTYL